MTLGNDDRPGRECYHCKQWIEPGEAHDCWTTTEAALTEDLSEDLRRRGSGCARPRPRSASSASTRRTTRSCSRASRCYFFVRPKRSFLELCVFLGRAVQAPQVRRVERASKTKFVHIIHDHASRRGRGAAHRLAAGGLRAGGRARGGERADRSRQGASVEGGRHAQGFSIQGRSAIHHGRQARLVEAAVARVPP